MKAFPSPHDPRTGSMQLGMELRDYFAAQAMQGMLAENGGGAAHNDDLAKSAYAIADAMMKARNDNN